MFSSYKLGHRPSSTLGLLKNRKHTTVAISYDSLSQGCSSRRRSSSHRSTAAIVVDGAWNAVHSDSVDSRGRYGMTGNCSLSFCHLRSGALRLLHDELSDLWILVSGSAVVSEWTMGMAYRALGFSPAHWTPLQQLLKSSSSRRFKTRTKWLRPSLYYRNGIPKDRYKVLLIWHRF